ncbi:MAG: hypothetical protein MI919_24195 [Holophagales bacterium]|nr:hypothetical protein [Holophagales bacterium]
MGKAHAHPRQLSLFESEEPSLAGALPSGASGRQAETSSGGRSSEANGCSVESTGPPANQPIDAAPGADAVDSAGRRLTALEAKRQLRARLEEALGARLASLTLTRNRSRIASARVETRPGGREALAIRVHRSFVEADDATVEAIAAFFTLPAGAARRAALHRLRRHYREHAAAEATAPRRLRLRTRGRHHDLQRLRDRLDREYFGGELGVSITWGRGRGGQDKDGQEIGDRETAGEVFRRVALRAGSRGFHIRLGSYHDRDRLVRIHPVLDRADVPEMVVESIVYHEMLHAALPPIRRGRRRSVHHAEFRRRERLYENHEAARTWIADNVERLARERG